MGKKASDSMLDGSLDILAECTEMYLNTVEPADRAAAIADSLVPVVTMAPGDFVKSDGIQGGGGRRSTVAAKNGLTASGDGNATHVSLCTGTELRYVTTTPSTGVANGNTVNIGSWDAEIADPT